MDETGWVLERASGLSYAELLSREIWSKLGCEDDADISVDKYGSPMADGVISATLRDSARFAQIMVGNGYFNEQQVVPSAWIDDIRNHGDNGPWSRHELWPTVFPDGRAPSVTPGGPGIGGSGSLDDLVHYRIMPHFLQLCVFA